jgi:F-type H+-transporting ATPase subunit delta
LGGAVGDEPKNLVRLLAQNRRLQALSAISEQYELLRAEAERTIRAELESALPISDEEQRRIAGALKTRLGCEVELVVTTNRELVGGAVIRAGDLVIDGSIRARLERLAAAVSA